MVRGSPPDTSYDADDDAQQLQRAGGVDGFVGRVGRFQVVAAIAGLAQGLDRELPIDHSNNDVAGGCRAVVFDHDQVAVEDAHILHAVAADLVHRGPARVVDEVVVQSDELGLLLGRGLRQAGADGAQNWAGEECLLRDDASLMAFDVAGVGQAPDEREHAGGRAQAQDLAELGHGWKCLVALPVGLEGPEVCGVFHVPSVENLFDGNTVRTYSFIGKARTDKAPRDGLLFETAPTVEVSLAKSGVYTLRRWEISKLTKPSTGPRVHPKTFRERVQHGRAAP